MGETEINSLVLNAGVQFPTADLQTEDGFETTFATNHLAHYLLMRLLLPKLDRNATVVITTSNTHARIKMLDVAGWANPQARGLLAGARAYASSKLCNLLTARALAMSKMGVTLGLEVTAYTPGFTTGTSLFRHSSPFQRLAVALLRFVAPIAGLSTAELAGQTLADLALGKTRPPAGRIYAALAKRRLTWPDPSDLASNDDSARRLWLASATLVGLEEDLWR